MQLGMIGLGRMGANIVRRLHGAGHAGGHHQPNRTRRVELRNQVVE